MLAAIESRLEELFETIESLPSDKVEAAEKVWMDMQWFPTQYIAKLFF